MKKLNVTTHKSKEAFWMDESGNSIPYARTTKSERLMERQSAKILKGALKINSDLIAFKNHVSDICTEVYEVFMAEKENTAPGKGNFTWYNFDRTIKVEISINEHIEFDDLTITACKDKLDNFLTSHVESSTDYLKDLIMEAFHTSRGKLDSKKVLGLLKYRSKIKHADFQKALDLLEESIRRPKSKTYFRIWAKDGDGEFQAINLNFSSI